MGTRAQRCLLRDTSIRILESMMMNRKSLFLGLGSVVLSAMVVTACFNDGADCKKMLSCAGSGGGPSGGNNVGGDAQSGGTSGSGSGSGSSSGGTGGSGGQASPACEPACKGDTPVCDETAKECVGCLKDGDCSGDTALCDTSTNVCVACLGASDCSPGTPVCDGGTCGACSSSPDCAEYSASLVCETGSGACVECTVGDESVCGLNSCDPATNTCTDTPRGLTGACELCVADSECFPNYRCVPMEFQGAPRDAGYCLKALKLEPIGCSTAPFSKSTPTRVSLSGAAEAQYCGIVESVTTCEAVLGAGSLDLVCSDKDECGVLGLEDARCQAINLVNLCTYSCEAAANCSNFLGCGGPSDSKYCGGP